MTHRRLTELVFGIVVVIGNTIRMRETFTLYYYLYLQLIIRPLLISHPITETEHFTDLLFRVQVNMSVLPGTLLEVGSVYRDPVYTV